MEVPTVTSEGDTTINLNIPITSATPIITETETRSPRTLLLMDHLLELLQQPPVDDKHGYNVFLRVKSMILSQKVLAQQKVVYLNLTY